MVEESKLLENLRKLMNLRELVKEQNELFKDIKAVLNTEFKLDFPDVVEAFRMTLSKKPNIDKLKTTGEVMCEDEEMTLELKEHYIKLSYPLPNIDLNEISLFELIALYHVNECNPGTIDKIIEKVKSMNEKMAENLRIIKGILALVKTVLAK